MFPSVDGQTDMTMLIVTFWHFRTGLKMIRTVNPLPLVRPFANWERERALNSNELTKIFFGDINEEFTSALNVNYTQIISSYITKYSMLCIKHDNRQHSYWNNRSWLWDSCWLPTGYVEKCSVTWCHSYSTHTVVTRVHWLKFSLAVYCCVLVTRRNNIITIRITLGYI